jgi:hydrogenase maturation protein HypF
MVEGLSNPTLAAGAHLKNTIALNKDNNVFISQHIGDLENYEAINSYIKVINDLEKFYEVKPVKITCDMHPDYLSTNFALRMSTETVQVQHHYAHILSCMAENSLEGRLLGVSWDGTGYGTDGTIWGGEFITANGKDFIRTACIKPFMLPGGEKSIHEIWRTGFSLLYEVYGSGADKYFPHKEKDLKIIEQMLEKRINSPFTSSVGRLFDGVASIMNIRQFANFEAQGAMELEFETYNRANLNCDIYNYSFEKNPSGFMEINWHEMIREITGELHSGISGSIISVKFHNTLADIIKAAAEIINYDRVVLSGGCFQNKYLLEKSIENLRRSGFKVYWHQRVPTNDGGISLGQIKYASYLSREHPVDGSTSGGKQESLKRITGIR